jgi:hypothetical protein
MGLKEKTLIDRDFVNMPANRRLFRINAGMGWQGKKIDAKPGTVFRVPKGVLILANPRPFLGAPEGFPDTAGWEEIEITPEMVGRKVAVFVGREYKATGGLRKAQKKFGEILSRMGGIFEVVRE